MFGCAKLYTLIEYTAYVRAVYTRKHIYQKARRRLVRMEKCQHSVRASKKAKQIRGIERKKRARRRSAALRTSRMAGEGHRQQGLRLMRAAGYADSQWPCLERLWTNESNWSTTDSLGSAYGIPQALPGSKMASEGKDWRTNPRVQVMWGLKYVKKRYGNPCNAYAHFRANNWY